jgi:hypothetical protein
MIPSVGRIIHVRPLPDLEDALGEAITTFPCRAAIITGVDYPRFYVRVFGVTASITDAAVVITDARTWHDPRACRYEQENDPEAIRRRKQWEAYLDG